MRGSRLGLQVVNGVVGLTTVVLGSVWLGFGVRSPPLVGFTLLEVIGAPVLVYWQHRVARGAVVV